MVFVGAVSLDTVVGVSWYFGRRCGSELRNSGTRELVGGATESVDEDTGAVVLVGHQGIEQVRWDWAVPSGYSRLRSGYRRGRTRRLLVDDLVTQEISAASEGRGELEGVGLLVELILLEPVTAVIIGFGNLEPLCVRSAELVARSRVGEAGVENSDLIDGLKKGKGGSAEEPLN